MQRKDVENLFYQNISFLTSNKYLDNNPLAVILGGQPACGKSTLTNIVKQNNSDRQFLTINGDSYRVFHPHYDDLILQPEKFSNETQIFSNVFTEKLIEEAQKKGYNVIVEGTMRNPRIPLGTSLFFKERGFNVECYAIAAPQEITAINIYNRYQNEVSEYGVGRLAELPSHNEAFKNVGKSLDALHKNKSVDKIHIYTLYGQEKVVQLNNSNGVWDNKLPPSHFIDSSRQKQLNNKYLLTETFTKGKDTLNKISDELKPDLKKILDALQEKINITKRRGYGL